MNIPTNSDGLIVPRLIPVAAYLCTEEVSDAARSRVLERLADGVSPRACALSGALDWEHVHEVERLVALGVRPIRGGAPAADAAPPAPPARELAESYRDGGGPDDWPRLKTADDRRRDAADVVEWYREHPDAD